MMKLRGIFSISIIVIIISQSTLVGRAYFHQCYTFFSPSDRREAEFTFQEMKIDATTMSHPMAKDHQAFS